MITYQENEEVQILWIKEVHYDLKHCWIRREDLKNFGQKRIRIWFIFLNILMMSEIFMKRELF